MRPLSVTTAQTRPSRCSIASTCVRVSISAPSRAGGVGERERELARVEVAVVRQVGGGEHAVGRHERELLLRLGRGDDLHRQAEGAGPGVLALDLLQPRGRRREPQAAELVPAGILAGLALQLAVEADGVHHHPRQRDGRAQLADEAGGVPGRAVRELVLLDEHGVRPAELGEVVEDASSLRRRRRSPLPERVPARSPPGLDQAECAKPARLPCAFHARGLTPKSPPLGSDPRTFPRRRRAGSRDSSGGERCFGAVRAPGVTWSQLAWEASAIATTAAAKPRPMPIAPSFASGVRSARMPRITAPRAADSALSTATSRVPADVAAGGEGRDHRDAADGGRPQRRARALVVAPGEQARRARTGR